LLKTIHFHLANNSENIHPILKIENALNPGIFTLDCFQIHIAGSPIERTQQLFDLHSFEAKSITQATVLRSFLLPVIQLRSTLAQLDEQKLQLGLHSAQLSSTPISHPPAEKDIYLPPAVPNPAQVPTHIGPSPSPQDLQLLIAADLLNNQKLTVESLIYFQTHDPFIAKIKNDLLGKKRLQTFILKNGVVCKLFSPNSMNTNAFAICIPTVLLTATLVYIHKFFLHPSSTNTDFQTVCSNIFPP
jgi:hypothetical protein